MLLPCLSLNPGRNGCLSTSTPWLRSFPQRLHKNPSEFTPGSDRVREPVGSDRVREPIGVKSKIRPRLCTHVLYSIWLRVTVRQIVQRLLAHAPTTIIHSTCGASPCKPTAPAEEHPEPTTDDRADGMPKHSLKAYMCGAWASVGRACVDCKLGLALRKRAHALPIL